MTMNENHRCQAKTEVYTRVCGYFRPVQHFNLGKKAEYRDRKTFVVAEGASHDT
jgi:ribonucleoside-triphosphate reductase